MKNRIIMMMVNVFIGMLDEQLIKKFVGDIMQFAEDYVKGTKSDLDDRIVIPILETMRLSLNIKEVKHGISKGKVQEETKKERLEKAKKFYTKSLAVQDRSKDVVL